MTAPPDRPEPRHGHRLALVAGLLAASVTACSGSGPDGPAAPLPSPTPELAVTLDEYRFGVEEALPAGRVVFRFTNAGEEQHRPLLLPLTDDIPPIAEQVQGDQRLVVDPFAGLNTVDPGEQGTFAVDLAPGQRYALVCLVAGDDGESHAVKGMTWEARAGEDEGSD